MSQALRSVMCLFGVLAVGGLTACGGKVTDSEGGLPTCDDQIKNGAETDVDCGGPCSPCGSGSACERPSDCESGICSALGRCIQPGCDNGQVEGDEACDDGNRITETECPYGTPTCTLCDATCQNVLHLTGRYCGDNVTDGDHGEECDAGHTEDPTYCPYGMTCQECSASCKILQLTGSYCGDGVVNAADGEACDTGKLCDDLTTVCTQDSDCAAGQVCAPRSGDGCTADCSNVEVCNDDVLDEGADAWRPIGLRRADQAATVRVGADGAQIVQAVGIAPDDSVMLWGTDVGGLFRSLDGGMSWEPANVGYHARGCSGIAFDPNAPQRILALGSNSTPSPANGLYLSEDGAASWRQVFHSPTPMANFRDMRRQLAFDASSRDPVTAISHIAYWSRAAEERAQYGEPEPYPAFYRSEDGGRTWTEVDSAKAMAGAWIAVDPRDGAVYAANDTGVHVSRDRGESWRTLATLAATGFDLSPTAPDTLWCSVADGVWSSEDSGANWRRIEALDRLHAGIGSLRGITVAPGDTQRVLLWHDRKSYDWPRYWSHDGGASWGIATLDGSQSFLPTNPRRAVYAFSHRDPDVVLAPGGDFPALSRDGGRSFRWSADGVNNLLIGTSFQFSVIDPDIVLLGSQDYACALTTDGGLTWTYSAPGDRGWGGYNYGAYASSPSAMVVGDAQSWTEPRILAHSSDGGSSWTVTDLTLRDRKHAVGYGDPRREQTLFWGQFRSTDSGSTWSEMQGVSAVVTHHRIDQSLYGVHNGDSGSAVVRSTDGGATWTIVAETDPDIIDVAVDHLTGRLWIAQGGHLSSRDGDVWVRHDLGRDQLGRRPRVNSVALDSEQPDIVYVASGRGDYRQSIGPFRSTDGGVTWASLRRTAPLRDGGRDGGFSSNWVRVHAITREAWFACSCAGLWALPAPVTGCR